MSLDGLLQGAGALLLMPVQESTATSVGTLARSIEGQLRDAEGVERSAMRSTAAIKVVRDQVTALLARCIAMSAPQLPATPAATSSSSAMPLAAAPAADEDEDEIEVEVEDEGAGVGAGAGAGASTRKRLKRDQTDEERRQNAVKVAGERFDRFPQWVIAEGTLPHVKGTEAITYRNHYIKTGEVFCKFCKDKPVKVGASTGNITQHSEKQLHKDSVLSVGKAGGGLNPFSSAMSAAKPLSAEDLQRREGSHARLRALTHACAIGVGTNPSQIVKQHGSGSLVSDCVSYLRSTSHAVGSSERTVHRDEVTAEGLLDAEVRSLLQKEFYAVGFDGTSMRREKVQLILVNAAKVGEPLLLDVVFPVDNPLYLEDPKYDFMKAAPDITKSLENFGCDLRNCTGGSCDNTSSQGMICKYIGISQIKCGVHIFNLVALALNHLKNFKYLVAGLGKLIYQGGGTKRAMEIEALGLSPRSMLTHDGRFGTHVETGNYVLANFDKIRTWVTTSSLNVKPPQTKVKGAKGAAGGGAGAGAVADEGAVEEDEDQDEEDILPDDDELESKEVAAAKHVERVVRAWSSPFAVVTLEISRDFFGNLNAILTQLSGEGDNVPPDVLVTISAYQRRLRIVQGDPRSIVRPALSKHNLKMPQRDFEDVSAGVKAMADLALEKLDKHLPPYVTLLKHRFIYTPRQMPPPLPEISKDDKKVTQMDLCKPFLGCLDVDYSAALLDQYGQYREDVSATLEKEASLPVEARPSRSRSTYEYWDSKEDKWPNLAKIAKWHINFPTGNISAERGCGKLRGIEAVWQRNSQTHDTVRRQMKFAYNISVLERLTRRELEHAKSFRRQ